MAPKPMVVFHSLGYISLCTHTNDFECDGQITKSHAPLYYLICFYAKKTLKSIRNTFSTHVSRHS